MVLEVEVVSKVIIQPSSPTPDRLRSYQLSFLDQITPSVYNPLVMFYPKVCDTEANKIKTSDQLKQSISNSLTYFYPLAGRIMENQMFVECNDEGIPFVEARVKCQFSDFIKNPVPSELNKLLPFDLYDAGKLPLGIQFNIFDCGGIGLAVCISHKIGDALSFFSFVTMWSAIARGVKNLVAPEFVSVLLFPPRNITGYNPNIRQTNVKIVTKRFVFTASKIEEIRGKYADNTSSENPKRPTRIEALSAFIWSRFVAATKVRSRPDTFCAVFHLVNLRARMDPPLPDYSFGNFYSFTVTVPSMDSGDNCDNLVSEIRDSIRKINKDYVKKVQDGQGYLDDIKEIAERPTRGETIFFSFTSLCRFPIYEADFGWGKPVWVGSAARASANRVVFLDTVSGDGIEAWISLTEEDMAKFDCDEELLTYIAPTNY
ncbi:hypothetical protein REPUB_Repub04eG0194000 [Reevesia pubescens]